ncbi:MAG: allophanate hydrolase subunit 1 [Ornithinimicrobium sp.]
MIQAQVLPMGDTAVLIEMDDIAAVLAVHAALQQHLRDARTTDAEAADDEAQTSDPCRWVEDVVPAARTLLLHLAAEADLAQVGRCVVDLAASLPDPHEDGDDLAESASGSDDVLQIPVAYDGEDLDDVARATGMSREDVIEAHTTSLWRVAFFGFAPGFAYLSGGDRRLHVSRRSEPRTTVPSGSVGLAGEFSAVYPRSSPGGWQLIGRTESVMWDQDRDPPSLLQPGSVVRFVRQDPT